MRFKILKQGGYGTTGIAPTGGNMSGPVVLSGAPSQPLQASTKGYVDASLGNLNGVSLVTGLVPTERLPAFTGDLTNVAGSNSFSLNNTGVTPSTYPKVTVTAKGRITNGYLLSESDLPGVDWSKIASGKPSSMAGYGITDAITPTGGVMSGPLVVNNAPSAPLHIATKAYVDALNAGNAGGSLKVGDVVRKATAVTPAGFLRCNGGEVNKNTYSALYDALRALYVKSTTLDYTDHSAVGSGRPWSQQYQTRSINQSDITGWTGGGVLPVNLAYAAYIVTKGYVYAIGGQVANAPTNKVYRASIDTNGVIGTWVEVGTIPANLYGHQAFVTRNKVFVTGGWGGSSYNSTVYTADINADGSLGAWTSNGNPTFAIQQMASVVMTKNRVYLIGGQDNRTGYLNASQYAPINADGTLGAWVNANLALPTVLSASAVAVTKNRVYIMGGFSNTNTSYSSAVYTAVINSDGSLGNFTAAGNLPLETNNVQAAVFKNRVFVFGNFTNGSAWQPNVYSALINSDGTLGSWTQGTSSNVILAAGAVVLTKTRIYYLGNTTTNNINYAPITGETATSDYSQFYNGQINKFDGTSITGEIVAVDEYPDGPYHQPGAGQPWLQQNEINTTQSADLGAWTETTPISNGCERPAIVVTKNRIYILSDDYGSARYSAPINANGTIGTWSSVTSQTTLPTEHKEAITAVIKNRVYIFGSFTTAVSMGTINADGTVSNFVAVNPTADTCRGGEVVVTHSRVYLIGGIVSGSAPLRVQSAAINADGTLGTWSVMTTNHPKCNYAKVAVIKNRVYLLGGQRDDNTKNISYTTINSDGTLNPTWIFEGAITQLTSQYGSHSGQVYVTKQRVYLISTAIINTGSRKNYSAPINSDGSLGTWVENPTQFPVSIYGGVSFAAAGRLYYFGGTIYVTSGDTWEPRTPRMFVATISGGLNDYTSYYDGSITVTNANNFRLPDHSAKELPGSYSYIKV